MTWKRVESSGVDPQVEEGLQARIADPLWLLARQWQVGEFTGEDAATPVFIQAEVETAQIAAYSPGPPEQRSSVSSLRGLPLETVVEAESVRSGPAGDAVSIESGNALIRELRRSRAAEAAVTLLRKAYPVELDPPSEPHDEMRRARLELLAARSLDGSRLLAGLERSGGDLDALVDLSGVGERARNKLRRLVTTWAGRERNRFVEPEESAWQPERMEYRFQVAVPVGEKEVQLDAKEYPGGRLDWYHFDVVEGERMLSEQAPVTKQTIKVLPKPVSYQGMPADRFWEFEEGDIWFGAIDGGAEDLPRAVIGAFATVYGTDWYTIPCIVPAGSISRVTRMRIIDNFGGDLAVDSAAVADGNDRVWRFFELSSDDGPASGRNPLLLIPPVLAGAEAGRPVEEVRLVRDEAANIAWAIEKTVEDASGSAVDRGSRVPPAEPVADDLWRYRLMTPVPDHWIPLLPVRVEGENEPAITLQRGRVAGLDGAPGPGPVGQVLEPGRQLFINEEEIPRGGVTVQRHYQLTRGGDGRVHLWAARRKRAGSGRVPDKLSFDTIEGNGAGPH